MVTTVQTKYPSVPIPTDDIDSIYQSVIAMRQTVQLLIVNAQQVTNQTLSQASQIFATKSDAANAGATVTGNLTTIQNQLTTLSQSITNLQHDLTALQNQVTTLGSIGSPTTVSPATLTSPMDGIAAVGTSLLYARQDHRHPTDTSLLSLTNNSVSSIVNASNDSAAASAGVPIGGLYRQGSSLEIRVT